MADPVTMAVVGATAGAALNKDDPLKGALLGAAGGFGGGAALGALGGGAAAGAAGAAGASTAGTASLMAGGGALAPGLGASMGAGGATLGTGVGLAAPTMAGIGLAPAAAGMTAGTAGLTAGSSLLAPSLGASAAAPTMLDKVGGWMSQNPTLTNMAAGTAINSMQAPPPLQSGDIKQGNSGLLEMMAQYGQMPQQPFTQQNRISLL